MSGTVPSPPPPPAGLPPPARRGVRRLNRWPLVCGVGICALVVGAGWYVIHSGVGGMGGTEVASDTGQEGNASEVLSRAPTGVIPAAYSNAIMPPPPLPKPAPPAAPAVVQRPVAPPPTETDAEIAVRRQAWTSYAQNLDEQRKRLMTQTVAGVTGDMIPASSQAAAGGQQTAQAGAGGGEGTAGIGGAGVGGPGGWGAQQQQRPDFWGGRQNPDYQQDIVTQPVSDFEVKAGDVIDAVLINGLNSDTKGEIVAEVTKPVLDYATGTHILIPQGSRLIGYYNTDVGYGQNRLEAGFDRVIFPPPGSESLRLVRTPGSDIEGYAGFHDQTDNHLWRIIGNALLASAFSAGIQLSQPPPSTFGTYSPGSVAAGALGQQANQIGNEFIRRGLDIPPTQRIRNGYHFTILVKQDIAFSRPWEPSAVPNDPIRLVNAN